MKVFTQWMQYVKTALLASNERTKIYLNCADEETVENNARVASNLGRRLCNQAKPYDLLLY